MAPGWHSRKARRRSRVPMTFPFFPSRMVKDSPTERILTSRWGFFRAEIHSSPLALNSSLPSFSNSCYFRGAALPVKKGSSGRQGQFGGGADQVGLEDRAVVGIHHGRLKAPFKKIFGMANKILVQGIRLGHEKNGRFLLGPPHPSAPLPGVDDAARIADQDADIQTRRCRCPIPGRWWR